MTHSSTARVSVFCFYNILTSSVIYYWTDARQNGIYWLNAIQHDVLDFCGDVLPFLFGSVKFCMLLCNSTSYYAGHPRWVAFGIFVFCFAFPYYDLFHLVNRSCITLTHILHGTQWTNIRRPSRGMGIVLSHAATFCHPLSKWRTMLIRHIDKKTSTNQGSKPVREAKELIIVHPFLIQTNWENCLKSSRAFQCIRW